jgi:hypothetical protein
VFLVAARPHGGQRTAGIELLGAAAVAFCVLAAACFLLAARFTTAHRALVLGIVGGIGAGVTDALTKSVAWLAGTQRVLVLGDGRLYLLLAVGLITFTMQQNGFRAAGLAASLPAYAVLEPVIGSLLGLFIYHERVNGGPVLISIEVLAVLAAIWGIARLAKSVLATGTRLADAAVPSQAAAPLAETMPPEETMPLAETLPPPETVPPTPAEP